METQVKNNTSLVDFNGFAVSINCVIFGYNHENIEVLLIDEGTENMDFWAIPGDYVHDFEGFDQSAARIMEHICGNKEVYIDQAMVSGEMDHFENGTLLTIAYFSTVNKHTFIINEKIHNRKFVWWPINLLPNISSAHKILIKESFKRLQRRSRFLPLGFYLLDNKFTLFELQKLYELVLEEQYDRPNFRRKMLATGLLEKLEI